MSIPFFIISYIYIYKKISNSKKELVIGIIKKGVTIALIAFAIAGWWFIRSYLLYDGDFLGLKSSDECAEINAVDKFKPSLIQTPQRLGESIPYMLFKRFWLSITFKSFIGVFSGLSIFLPRYIYIAYFLMYFFAFVGVIIYFINNIRSKYYKNNKNILLLEGTFVICTIITIFLSIYYSYTSDFQPQGRYIMPMLIPFAYFVTLGIKEMMKRIFDNEFIKEKFKNIKFNLEKILIYTLIVILIIIVIKYLPMATI